jgi:hypothetical protein
MNTVPFKLSNVFGGFGDGDGLIRNEGAELCLEYQVKDGLIGAIKSDVKRVQIPFDELVSVTLTKGWLGTKWLGIKLIVQVSHMELLEDVPGASQGRIELSISGKDYDAAEDFVQHLHQPNKASCAT